MNIFKKKLIGGSSRGFTLIELLVVISIIGFLSSVVLASMKTAREKALDSKIVQDLRQFAIGEQLYYDEHKTYSLGDGDNNIFAVGETKNTFLTKDLNIFSTKIAEAYTNTNCDNFVNIANILVAHKYLSAVPRHPKDNGTTVCYKAATTTSNFTAYTDLSTGKRVGVILGDITVANLVALNDKTGDEYPRSTSGGEISSLSTIGDVILGHTSGSGTLITGPVTYTLTTSGGDFEYYGGMIFRNPDYPQYDAGESVSLWANSPNAGIGRWIDQNSSDVVGTSGCGYGDSTCTIEMISDRTVTVEPLVY